MRQILAVLLSAVIAWPAVAQEKSASIPVRNGFHVQKTSFAQLDADPASEQVILFGHDNGHWPEFDLFKAYIAVVDTRSRAVEFLSDEFVTDRYNLTVEDRDGDGIEEFYYYFIDMDSFQTAPDGYSPSWKYEYRRGDLVPPAKQAVQKPRKEKIRTLVIAGMDGSHYSEGAAECIRQILENSGLFSVDVHITPKWGGDMSYFHPDFRSYSLVILDYGGVEWAPAVKKDFEAYVENGGGVVFIHSSVIPMENWDAYNRMSGLGAWNGRDEKWGPYVYMQDGRTVYDHSPGWAGHHGLQHLVVVDHQASEHPIVKGLPKSWLHFKDEIYTRLRGPAENLEILATTHDNGRDEPLLWTVRYGKGRIFADVLGHCGSDPNMTYAMTCTGYQVTLLRGCEWAATGKVTQPAPVDFPDKEHYTLRKDFMDPAR